MATTKTLTPTNQAITLAEFTEKPDNRTNVTNDDKLGDAINALNGKTAAKRYYNAFTVNSENVSWSWGIGYLQNVGDLLLLSTGITVTEASSDWLNILTVQSDYKPTYEVRGIATPDDGSGTKIIRITTEGNVDIYKPSAKSYWFEMLWLKNISN